MFGNIIAFRRYRAGSNIFGDEWSGLKYFKQFMKDFSFWRAFKNTLTLNLSYLSVRFPATLIFALLLNEVRRLPWKKFVQTVSYLPHFISVVVVAGMVKEIISTNGPINSILESIGFIKEPIDFLGSVLGTRSLVGLMNFLMWFGNTTIMLMAAIMAISNDIFEASEIDGCNSIKRFFYIILPLIRPILAYTLITSIIGGLQMFDVPQILTNGQGNPNRTSMTLIMFLNSHLKSKNYGMAGALSVYLFIVSGILCFIVYKMTNDNDPDGSKRAAKKKAKAEKRKG